MFDLGAYEGQTVFVTGADSAVAAPVALALDRAGALVVAVGRDHRSLVKLEESSDGRIEPLCLRPRNREELEAMRRIWANDPVDLMLDFQTLTMPGGPELAALFCDYLRPALTAAGGHVVLIGPRMAPDDDPAKAARAAGFEGLRAPLCTAFAREGIRVNAMTVAGPQADESLSQAILDSLVWLGASEAECVTGAVIPVYPRAIVAAGLTQPSETVAAE